MAKLVHLDDAGCVEDADGNFDWAAPDLKVQAFRRRP